MTNWQYDFLSVYLIFSLFSLFVAARNIRKHNNFGMSGVFSLLGIFVWADAIVFSPFWIVVTLTSLYFNNFILFLVFLSVFWLVRSLGEVIYWINQQFSRVERNKPQDLLLYKYLKDDSVYFIYQIFWQVILIFSIIASFFSFYSITTSSLFTK